MYTPRYNIVETKGAKEYYSQLSFSFSLGGRVEHPIPNQDIPGPGQYDINSKLAKSCKTIKMVKPNVSRVSKDKASKTPDPTAYNPVKKFSENYGPKFTFGIGERVNNLNKSCAPGPGAYDNPAIIGTEGC